LEVFPNTKQTNLRNKSSFLHFDFVQVPQFLLFTGPEETCFMFTSEHSYVSMEFYTFYHQIDHYAFGRNTVDGRNPAPVDMVNIPLFTRFYTSQVVQKPLWQ